MRFDVPIAAGVLYPAVGVLLSPMLAAAAVSSSSVSVIGNALRPRRQAIWKRVALLAIARRRPVAMRSFYREFGSKRRNATK